MARAPRIIHKVFGTNDPGKTLNMVIRFLLNSLSSLFLDLELDLDMDLDLDLNLDQWLCRPVWCKFQCGKGDILMMKFRELILEEIWSWIWIGVGSGPSSGSGPGSGLESGPVVVQTRLVQISTWKRRYSGNEV